MPIFAIRLMPPGSVASDCTRRVRENERIRPTMLHIRCRHYARYCYGWLFHIIYTLSPCYIRHTLLCYATLIIYCIFDVHFHTGHGCFHASLRCRFSRHGIDTPFFFDYFSIFNIILNKTPRCRCRRFFFRRLSPLAATGNGNGPSLLLHFISSPSFVGQRTGTTAQ